MYRRKRIQDFDERRSIRWLTGGVIACGELATKNNSSRVLCLLVHGGVELNPCVGDGGNFQRNDFDLGTISKCKK